jgi:hypothetical protein
MLERMTLSLISLTKPLNSSTYKSQDSVQKLVTVVQITYLLVVKLIKR